MREIKFRAFYDGKMYRVTELLADDTVTLFDEQTEETKCVRRDFVKLMQFTGLHDKNGMEIYEGDILNVRTRTKSFTPGRIGEHTWSDYHEYKIEVYSEPGMWLVGFPHKKDHPQKYHTHLVTILSNTRDADGYVEVIGNIYENSDLLK